MGRGKLDATMKAGSVSSAPSWSTESVSKKEQSEFTTVAAKPKKHGGSLVVEIKADAPPKEVDDWVPEKKKPPQVITNKKKPKPLPKAKPAKQVFVDNRDTGDGDGEWATVDKAAKKKGGSLKVPIKKDDPVNDFDEYKPNAKAAPPVVISEAERKKQRNAAKKAAKELERKRNAANAAALKKAEESAEFTTVTKGAKVPKVKTDIQQFGSATAFGKLQKGPQHMKVPKAQKQRQVEQVSEEQLQAILRERQRELTGRPAELEVTFNVEVQNKWYNISDLLSAENFSHAPKFVAACVTQKRIMGGYFIAVDGKFFSNGSTVDEWWMATSSYLVGFTKLLGDIDTPVNITPYWAGDGKDATATIAIKKPTLQEGCYPQFTITHNQKQGAQLQSITGSVHGFAESLISETKCLEGFVAKIEKALEELKDNKRFKSPEKQKQLQAFGKTIPTKIDVLITNLEYALKEFAEKYPLPSA
eukprot:TRINITY_DN508_c3_g1_i1.p1 TRINITY_DN508_c3_g1~~TRINITY_DN508_c3_g1_i1.p1  ORF type:complete len:490 (+),score=154.32 TRINITY_DN508_c3_g1_i1:51-1472(+)